MSQLARMVMALLCISACLPAMAGSWTITFSGGSGTNGDGTSATPSISNTSNSASWSITATQSGSHTSSVSGPTSITCSWSGGTSDQSVRAAVILVQPSASYIGSSGSAADGYGDTASKNQIQRNVYSGTSAAPHYPPAHTGDPSFTYTLNQATASATGYGTGGDPGSSAVSVSVTIYNVGFAFTGATQFSDGVHICIGQQFTVQLVSQVPANPNAADTYTWEHPAPGDTAGPFASYSANSTSATFQAFADPPTSTTATSVTCYFSAKDSAQQPECNYYSGTANQTIDVEAKPVPVDAPSAQFALFGTPSLGKMQLGVAVYNPDGTLKSFTPSDTSPTDFLLWGGEDSGGVTSGMIWEAGVTDPAGYTGAGQFGFVSLLQDQLPSPPPSWGLDKGLFPYAGWFAANNYSQTFDDVPGIGNLDNQVSPYTGNYNTDFHTFAFYEAPGGSLFFPVCLLSWTADGTCALSGSLWTQSNSSAMSSPAYPVAPSNFPTW